MRKHPVIGDSLESLAGVVDGDFLLKDHDDHSEKDQDAETYVRKDPVDGNPSADVLGEYDFAEDGPHRNSVYKNSDDDAEKDLAGKDPVRVYRDQEKSVEKVFAKEAAVGDSLGEEDRFENMGSGKDHVDENSVQKD